MVAIIIFVVSTQYTGLVVFKFDVILASKEKENYDDMKST